MKKSFQSFRSPASALQSSRRGFALVVILAFVVLLTVLVLAYFSYSALQRQISNASSNQAAVEIFAQGAINTIISDFKQEISDGSTNFAFGTNTVSIPKASTNAAPFLVGTSTNLPNLLKRSAGGLAFSPGAASRASAVSSTNASQNGRSISPARWNAALLLPKANTNSTTDLTPANFTPPDWILVNRAGGNPTAWNTNMIWSPDVTNTSSVIGRFAYAIYDEGGLLDVNVAGCPPGTTNTITSYKNALAFADLAQVGLDTNTVSAIVGWRNTASAQPGGSFPAYTFDAASRTNFLKTLTNSSGFLRAANTNLFNGESDRQFSSRQQLIQFINALPDAGGETKATRQNALQYLATFTRALEQPSFAPDPNRPKIVSDAPSTLNNYRGGNDAYSADHSSDSIINPSFLTIRVTSAFPRFNGAQAVLGEPLVKTRFPISRLAWLTWEGPSSNASSATKTALLNTGVSQTTIDAGTAANILASFGLTWNSSTKVWTYSHGVPGGRIGTLQDVQALGSREPDFAELLKASIAVGSLGKANCNGGTTGSYHYTLDSSVDLQVLQIMANLMDQADPDSYPTIIQFGSPTIRTVRGVEDLPYFYRFYPFAVVTRNPSPLLAKNDTVILHNYPITYGSPPTSSGTGDLKLYRSQAGTPEDKGETAYLLIPEVWNPHDAGGTSLTNGTRPSQFRVTAATSNPDGGSPSTLTVNVGLDSPTVSGVVFPSPTPNPTPNNPNVSHPGAGAAPSPSPNPTPLTRDSTAVLFQDSGGSLFRQPTLLWRPDAPANSNVVAGPNSLFHSVYSSGSLTDANTNQSYIGMLVAVSDISFTWSATYNATSTTWNGTSINILPGTALMSQSITWTDINKDFTFRVEYQDPNDSTKWIIYDEKYVNVHNAGAPNIVVNKQNGSTNLDWTSGGGPDEKNPILNNSIRFGGTAYDPRGSRFSSSCSDPFVSASMASTFPDPLIELTASANSVALNNSMGSTKWTMTKTQRPSFDRGQYYNYNAPGDGASAFIPLSLIGFYSANSYYPQNSVGNGNYWGGYLTQNDQRVIVKNASNASLLSAYYQDADGVSRRAMGGYTLDPATLTNTSPNGLPLVTATDSSGNPIPQMQSRPLILNRPFKNIAEMSYAFRGTPWKQIDFFTPESGDTALLDVFCVNEPPTSEMVAGRVNLNTRQPLVFQALLSGAYREPLGTMSTPPSNYAAAPLSAAEASSIANKLVEITSGTNAFRGPLANVSEIVGKYVFNPGDTTGYPDPWTVAQSRSDSGLTSTNYTFSGLTSALGTLYGDSKSPVIQRLRESAIRPLAACGQTRVWNLLIDVVAQTGRYPQAATAPSGFVVESEKRYWVHVSIDRLTGRVIDQQIEAVIE